MSSTGKKRKSGEGLMINPPTFDDQTADAPVLASFPDFPSRPHSVKFQSFVRRESELSSEFSRKKRRVVVGQNNKLEYVGDNISSKNYCRYVVGVYDKKTKRLTLRESDIFRMTTTVKTLKRHESKHIGEKNMLARNALGEAFGTKKRRQAIRALEKNQVDVGGLTEVADVIKDAIDEKAAALPTREEIQAEAKQDRAIPPYKREAQSPAEVYNPEDIVSPVELNAIPFKQYWKARLAQDVKALLEPIQPTSWVWDKIHASLQAKDDSVKLRRLIYLAYMMKFYSLKERELKGAISEKLGGAPQEVADKLMERFTEYQEDEGRTKYRMSAKLKDKLLAYILALCLILNDFKFDLAHMASDLKISAMKVTKVAKELGCRVETRRTDDGPAVKKVALVVPLQFPQRTR